MSLHGKFLLALLLTMIAGTQLKAQWGPPNNSHPSPPGGSACNSIMMAVTNSTGTAIMGAAVIPEDGGIPLTTDSQGFVSIPGQSIKSILPVVTISASGYHPVRVTLAPDLRCRIDIRLDRRERSAKPARNTISALELSPNVQKQSVQLQLEAKRAITVNDYDGAEKLLMQALQLTPSDPSIPNNLGVVALHRHDLDTAASWFEKASQMAPFKAEILGNFGLVRWMQRRNEESYAILRTAFSRGYESNLGNYILGTVGLEKGVSKEAANHLKKIPEDGFPYRDFYLSIALRNCGKSKAADESYRSFLRHNPAPFLVSVLR